MSVFLWVYNQSKKADSVFLITLFWFLYYRIRYKKRILIHSSASIRKGKNIEVKGLLSVGMISVGFANRKDRTYLNVSGKLVIDGDFSIARGCRFDIGTDAVVKLGNNSYINSFSTLIAMNGLEIGKNCSIAWDCQFLDEGFHELNYEEKKSREKKEISIADDVWIGSKVSIYMGTTIKRGSVIAANSVVKGCFDEENVLIAGNPAKVIKRNVSWE